MMFRHLIKLLIYCVFGTFVSASIAVAEVGFASGNEFLVAPIQGEVSVLCPGSAATFFCRDTVMDPVCYDYFQGPSGIVADQVQLSALHPDGSYRKISADYNAEQARTFQDLNLWISTLFQK